MATFVADELDPQDGYKLASGLVVPRPIGWIGTISASGEYNLAPYSFFNLVAASPLTLVISPIGPPSSPKDTLANVTATGVFTHNVVTDGVVEAMNVTAASLPPGEDEFAHAGLTAVDSDTIGAPRVGEAKASFECVVTAVVPIGSGPMSGNLIIGEIKVIHVDDDLLDGTRIDFAKLGAIGRLAGSEYLRSDAIFSLERPA